jgi:hypothetical protein
VVGSGTAVGILKRRLISSQTGTIRVWKLKKELWHRLENKAERAHRGSVSFFSALHWGFHECVHGPGECSSCFLVYLCGLLFYFFLRASDQGGLPFKSGYSLQDKILKTLEWRH